MNIEDLKRRKQEKGYTFDQLSELSGVPLGTIQKIFTGETKHPRYATLEALERVLSAGESLPYVGEDSVSYVAEEAVAYHAGCGGKRQGEYTLEDYYALPDDQRVELIDGVFYEMTAPATFHQLMAGELHRQISNFIIEQKGDCVPFISPVDVQLDNDDRTMVEPDVVIVCNPDQIIRRCILGAPDFVLEVISPSTKRKDYTIKLAKYQNAGVREYWLVDPYQKVVLVYFFEDETYPVIYPIDGDIPVNIYEGKLVLSFARIGEWANQA